MENTINFEEGKVTSLNKWYNGTINIDGVDYGYTLMANWNDWDDWTVEDLMWDEEEPENVDDVIAFITQEFNDHMYGDRSQ